ncbi:MAG TPA: SdrD B-like domain-containing protein, partial [Saprospiraceae bacterium]|nr:SdrD B-like domain-containing protein [Saprospiraceae bacterium]
MKNFQTMIRTPRVFLVFFLLFLSTFFKLSAQAGCAPGEKWLYVNQNCNGTTTDIYRYDVNKMDDPGYTPQFVKSNGSAATFYYNCETGEFITSTGIFKSARIDYYSSTGTLLWSKTLGLNEGFQSIAISDDGMLISGASSGQVSIVRTYDRAGNLVYSTSIFGPYAQEVTFQPGTHNLVGLKQSNATLGLGEISEVVVASPTGSLLRKITPYAGNTSLFYGRIKFCSPTTFYVTNRLYNGGNSIIRKFTIVNASGVPDANGSFYKLDDTFGTMGTATFESFFFPTDVEVDKQDCSIYLRNGSSIIKVFQDGTIQYEYGRMLCSTGIYQAMTLCSCPLTTGCMMEVTAGPSIEYCGATPSTTFTAQVVPGTSGCTSGFSYLWSNGATGSSMSVTKDGTYQVTVTDCNGCTASSQVSIGKESYIYVVRTDLASGKQLLRYSVSQMGNPGYMPTIINSNLPGTLGIDFAYNCAGGTGTGSGSNGGGSEAGAYATNVGGFKHAGVQYYSASGTLLWSKALPTYSFFNDPIFSSDGQRLTAEGGQDGGIVRTFDPAGNLIYATSSFGPYSQELAWQTGTYNLYGVMPVTGLSGLGYDVDIMRVVGPTGSLLRTLTGYAGSTGLKFSPFQFCTATTFYQFTSQTGTGNSIVRKFFIVNASGVPDPNGAYFKLDPTFGTMGTVKMDKLYNTEDFELDRNDCSIYTRDAGNQVIKIASDGSYVDYGYAKMPDGNYTNLEICSCPAIVCNVIANAGNDTTICSGRSTTITATATNGLAPLKYEWSNGLGLGQSKTVSPVLTTTYTVTITDANGCTATDNVIITVASCGSIGNSVWVDANGNGIQDPTETGLNGVSVLLKDASGTTLATTVTSANPTTGAAGYYTFDNLIAGTYKIMVMYPTGYTGTGKSTLGSTTDNDSNIDPTTGTSDNIVLTAGQVLTNVDAGIYQLASIGNYIWDDKNGNGIQEPTESGINGVTVLLKNAAGTTVQTTVTTTNGATSGYYQFANLVPATYTVMVMSPTGYTISKIDAPGSTDLTDSDFNPSTGNTTPINLASGENNQTIDGGIYQAANIGNYVWRDTDGDGIQDATEVGINGVTVLLKDNTGATVATTITGINPTTGANGYYNFTTAPGTYFVMIMAPTGNTISPQDAPGSTDFNDSDINSTTGNSPAITVAGGETNATVDAGLFQPASIGNYVWEDLDKDGVQDAAELGINGVSVLLKNTAGTTLQTTLTTNNPTTGAAGYYQFTNLLPADYIVMFMAPATYKVTSANTTTDTNDSDADPLTGNTPVTTITSGESEQTIDAGLFKQATIGDYVWRDTDGDGIQDPTESGLNGVTVVLKDATGTTVATTVTGFNPTTGAAGYYNFAVDPGTYAVMVMAPTGNTISPNDAVGSNDNNDSDVNPTTGTSPNVTVTSGQNVAGIDAGLFQAASLGNYVWEDADKDGVQDATEIGVNGVTVLLKNAAGTTLQTTTTIFNPTTGAAGYYQFSNLAPGDYIVMFMMPTGYNETSANTTTDGSDSDADPATGNAPLTNLVSGESDQTIDAGIYRSATIGDYVWRDTDGDGIQDPTESGINGVTVLLKDATGATVATTVTAANPTTGTAGYYNFSVDPGTYAVMVMAPTGNTISPNDAVGSNDNNDSDVNPTTGTSPNVTVTSGQNVAGIDAGLFLPASIGNYVWEDLDKDGVQDAAELGINGVSVLLKNTAGVTLQTTTTTNNPTTGAAGYYQFVNLAPADYIVMFMAPTTYKVTSANTTTDTNDSDADPITGNAPVTTLTSGESEQTIDAGLFKQATIGDYVWRDSDADGIQDPTESGINGVTVILKDATGTTVATTVTGVNPTTGAAGYYTFSVDPGTYAVMVMAPTGNNVSPQDAVGSNDNTDSDVNPTTGTSPNVTVTSGQIVGGIDAGLFQPATLGNYVWEDADKDGIQDGTELGVNGVTVQLKNAAGIVLQTTVTANGPTGAGYYQFSNLTPGDYIVTFVTPLNYKVTSANTTGDAADSDIDAVTGSSPLTNLVSGESEQTIDAGIYRQATIGDYVWRDTDGDGIQDLTESGINGVTVLLKDAAGNTISSTVTSNGPTGAGYYNFTVDPGTYSVTIVAPTGNSISPKEVVAGTDANNSDVDPTTGNSAPITVTSGESKPTVDAGLYQAASIGNYVWEDADKDGIQDGTELGVNGVTVQLKNAVGTILQT